MREKECPLILAGVMAGKSGYSACRLGECAWWSVELRMCCIPAAVKPREEKIEVPGPENPPIPRCADCEHSYADLGGRCCSYGVCVDCEVPEDFYCANFKFWEGFK